MSEHIPAHAGVEELAATPRSGWSATPAELEQATVLANGLLCGLSVGAGLDGLPTALGRVYRILDDLDTGGWWIAALAAALIRQWLAPLPGDERSPLDGAALWFSAEELAEHRKRYPWRRGELP
ncbi:MAG TPA: hypothetical protein VEX11_06565 [Acetobacteraceae bacterium]|nr:hypothetical protein [Acetobacteraceae bacterium]